MKKTSLTFMWLAMLAAWFGLYKFIQYQIDMYYSKLAATQVENDSAYAELKFHGTVDNIALLVFLLVALFFVYRIGRIWFKQERVTTSEP